MSSLIYRSCNGLELGESSVLWDRHERQSCRSSTDFFDSTADLNTSRSTKEESISRSVNLYSLHFVKRLSTQLKFI